MDNQNNNSGHILPIIMWQVNWLLAKYQIASIIVCVDNCRMTSKRWKSGKEINVGGMLHRKTISACLKHTESPRVVFYCVLCDMWSCTLSACKMLWFERQDHLWQYCHFKPWTLSLNYRFRNEKTVSHCCKMPHENQVLLHATLPCSGAAATDIWPSLV